MPGGSPALHALVLATLGVLFLPLAYLVVRAAGAGVDGISYLMDGRTLGVIANSILLALAVIISSASIGIPFAWLTARTDLPLRGLWLVLGLLPLVVPSYIGAMTLIAIFGPRGYAQQALAPLGVTSLPTLYGFGGAWLAITLFTYPYIALPVRAALLNMDPALEETARGMGLNRWAIFWRVIAPQLRPALAAGVLLSALYTLSDFGAVALMRFNAFTRVIYSQYSSSFDRERAAILSVVLVVLTIALLFATRRSSSVQRNYRIGTGAQRRPRIVRLNQWRIPALLFMVGLVGLGTVAPVGVLVGWLGMGDDKVQVALMSPLVNTVGVSARTAVAVALLALAPAWLATRSPSRLSQRLCELTYIGNGLPGLIIALALVFFAANYLSVLYQTLPVLILGYAMRFLPLSVGATRSALSQINPRIEEAGRSLGLTRWKVLARVTVPAARGGMLAGMALVFLSVMKELPTTLLLSPTGFETFATRIWTAHREINFAGTASPSLALIVVSAISLTFILRQEG